jgi:Electron transfer flavoprotein, alpha subunit
MTALVLAEHDGGALKAATRHAVTAARALGGPVRLLVVGSNVRAVAEAGAAIAGVDTVLVADDAAYAHPLAEAVAPLVAVLARECAAVLAPATTSGKNILPRVAAMLDVQQVSEIVAVVSPDTFVRPIYAGNALATVQSRDPVKVVTVRTTAFEAAGEGGAAEIVPVAAQPPAADARFVGQERAVSERPELTAARVVVSGGRGMQSGDNFRLLEAVADRLGGAVGASRAAVDAGFVSNDLQVGQTGKIVAPDLYVAVGISGAIQHLAGMKDSKVIVAINKDEEAPIFQVADYGLVGDLFTFPRPSSLPDGRFPGAGRPASFFPRGFMDDTVLVTDAEGIRIIRINRPDKRNALTQAMYAAMAKALAEGEADASVRVFVLTGTADVFTAGNDLNDFLAVGDLPSSPAADFLRALAGLAKPAVAAVNGAAIGIGATLLLHCDLVYAVPEARLQFPFINLALVPEAASTLLLPRLVGHQRAAELLMLGDPFDAAAAERLGLVNRVVEGDLAAEVLAVARRLADKPAAALAANKALLKRGDEGVAARLETEFAVFAECLRSWELKEAVAAFFDKRPPDFRRPR